MGTRGKFGFFYKGKYYMAHNSLDSYPGWLGVCLLLDIIHADLAEWVKLLENIKEVSYDVKPTAEDIKKLEKYTDMSGGGSLKNWDNLLRLTRGSFYHTLRAGYMVNMHDYDIGEEFIYVLDFDNKQFRAKAVRGGDDINDGEGDDDNLNVTINLRTEELVKLALKWSKGDLLEDYDPEKELARLQEKAKSDLEKYRSILFFFDE